MWRAAGVAFAFNATKVAHDRNHNADVASCNGDAADAGAQLDDGGHVDGGPTSRFAKMWNVLSSTGNTDSDKKAKKKAKKAAHKEKQAEEKKGL